MSEEKHIHYVSSIGAGTAFRAVEEISNTYLHNGDTVMVYPGVYGDPNTANVSNLTIEGMGDKQEVVFNAGFTIPAGTTGTVRLKNLTIQQGLHIGNTSATVNVEGCDIDPISGSLNAASDSAIANAAIAVAAQAQSLDPVVNVLESTLGGNVTNGYGVFNNRDGAVSVYRSRILNDRGLYSNGAMTVEHSTFTGPNVYATTTGTDVAITVRSSVAAASNAGDTIETVVAEIS